MFTIDELVIPATLDAPTGAEFARALDVGNQVEALSYGTPDLAYEASEELPYYLDAFNPHRLLVARVDGSIIGRAVYESSVGEEADTAWVSVEVLQGHRGKGIGTALAQAVEAIVAAEGKAKAVAYIGVQDAPGERIPSPTGFGSVPAESRDVRFLLARGYSFEQVERLSRLELPVAGLDELVRAAAERSGPDYLVHTWEAATPERWRADLALLGTRMSTDAPSAGLDPKTSGPSSGSSRPINATRRARARV